MTFRRLALALALLTAPVDADDFEELERTNADSDTAELTLPRRRSALVDLIVRHDGSIDVAVAKTAESERTIPWSLVRLVLADVSSTADENQEPLWIPATAERRSVTALAEHDRGNASFRLNTLGGVAVVGPHGETIGVVRGWLVSWERGRVLALAVDIGAFLGTQSRIVALPWSWLRVPIDSSSSLSTTSDTDLDWLRWANEVDLKHVL